MKSKLLPLIFVVLTACSSTWETSYKAPNDGQITRNWNVREVSVQIPQSLTTTEQNSYAPNADIVWHGDPSGDRRAQVATILRESIAVAAQPLRGARLVKLQVVLQEFHAVTPRARAAAPSAVHNISFTIQAIDIRTGELLTPPDRIRADIEAFTGEAAFDAIQRGQTQKVRIAQHLRSVAAGWLGIGPDPRRRFSQTGR